MTAAELIEKLSNLDPGTEVWIDKEGCGCCEGYREQPAVLARDNPSGRIYVVAAEEVA